MSIRPGKRFDVFRRDGFVCQYCGRRPPDVLLECDHIVPRAKGGTDDEENLVTSCEECNRGKSAKSIDEASRPLVSIDQSERMRERAAQVHAYADAVEASRDALDRQFDMMHRHWCRLFGGTQTERGWQLPQGVEFPAEVSLRQFLQKLPLDEILEAMDATATSSCPPYRAHRYFYAVCWRKIRKEPPPQ